MPEEHEAADTPATDELQPMTAVQIEQTRAFVDSLQEGSEPYWDTVETATSIPASWSSPPSS